MFLGKCVILQYKVNGYIYIVQWNVINRSDAPNWGKRSMLWSFYGYSEYSAPR